MLGASGRGRGRVVEQKSNTGWGGLTVVSDHLHGVVAAVCARRSAGERWALALGQPQHPGHADHHDAGQRALLHHPAPGPAAVQRHLLLRR